MRIFICILGWIICVALVFVVPKYAKQFSESGQELPRSAVLMMNASNFTLAGGWLLLAPLTVWSVLPLFRSKDQEYFTEE